MNYEIEPDIIGYCNYCKEEIYDGEMFVVYQGVKYHAQFGEKHDNCFRLVFGDDE